MRTGNRERDGRQTAFAVLSALLAWADFDAATLWWVARAASHLARTGGRPVFGEALDLLDAMRQARQDPPTAPSRWPDPSERLN